jgi:proteasome lid subunit RPN8/RPN11
VNETHIRESAGNEIRDHAARSYPYECCGALLGEATSSGKRITEIIPMENARSENRETRFLVGDDDYRRAEQEADRRGLTLLGFYHSHPDHPAAPSPTDLAQAFPWFSYVILSVQKGRPEAMTSWVLAEERDRFLEEKLSEESPSSLNRSFPEKMSERTKD